MTEKIANRLIYSTSPYLQQHAYNPVDWHEWNNEALSKARAEDKPILVSIGYSSCHWCHVMEREVFEKESIAQLMNDSLVCIKVDREERPDVDSIYMEAVQAMGIHGGWPLNVFLTPDQKPFYGGTYFPPDQWISVINGVRKAYKEKRKEVDESAIELTKALANQDTSHLKRIHESKSFKDDLEKTYGKLSASFDRKWGGLDKAPKFVMPSVWLWLLRYYKITKNTEALDHLKLTLQKIAWGGIYDQIGGGFARYSVDGYWFVPHFEKMLYDNAQLVSLYSEAYAVTKDKLFKNVVEETFSWLQSEMMNPGGGFYSALDADSEGVEGKFYIWKRSEIDEILGDDADLFADYYNVKDEGNWEHGNSILIRTQPDEVFLAKHGLQDNDWQRRLRQMQDKLLTERDKRVRPGLDDKVILSWNAMMIVGLTDAYKYLDDEKFLRAATKNFEFLENNLIEQRTLYRSFKEKRSDVNAFLDDYAYVIQACLRIYSVSFDESYITKAKAFTEFAIEHFFDSTDGFFFYTSNTSESLIARRKELFDNVIPASNSVMAQNLYQLGSLLDNEEWKRIAENMTNSLAHLVIEEPNYMSNWGIAYLEMKHKLAEVVISATDPGNYGRELSKSYQPFALLMSQANSLPLTAGKKIVDAKDTIYVCYDKVCQRPVHDVSSAIEQLEKMR